MANVFFHIARWKGISGAGKCARKPHRWQLPQVSAGKQAGGGDVGLEGDSRSLQWRKFMGGQLELTLCWNLNVG